MTAWELELVPRSAALLGAVWDPTTGAHLASAAVPAPSGEPLALLPGSSLRGVLRGALARFTEARTGETCARPAPCACLACALFGSAEVPGKLRVTTAQAPARWVSSAGVAIDRTTRTAWRAGHALWAERKAFVGFRAHVQAIRALTDDELELLERFWAWLAAVGISLGQRKSAGAGSFELRVKREERRRPKPERRGGPSGEVEPRRFALRIRLLEPAHIVGPRQRDFYRDALDVIPGSTIQGAIGQALAFMGADDLAGELLRSERAVLVGPAFPVEPEWPVGDAIPWLSRRSCRGAGHTIDLLAAHVAAALGGEPVPTTCPRCGAPLRRAHAPVPPRLVLGHTAVDPRTRRAARGQLHYEVALAPGTTFEAQIVARPDQAEILTQLHEVWVGGRRARGMGRATLEIHEIPSPPLGERMTSLTAAVRERGADGAARVAALGLLSDAAVEPSLAAILRRRGLEPVDGELRTVERGGWDELNGRPRALREILAAGSWVAVRCPTPGSVAALEELERRGLPDPDGISPLLMVVRGNEEVVEVATVSKEEPTAGAARDQLVRDVRALCKRHAGQLPERSQLHNLLRYAQQTPSVEEVALFFEYQASRREFEKQAPFLRDLAEQARRRYAGDPAGLRTFLAVVVRAAQVERQARRREDG